jgi:hypothetical protein
MHYKVSTYSYLFIFLLCFTGYHSDPVLRLRRASNAAGGGRATLSCPPPAHAFIFLLLLLGQMGLEIHTQL